MIGGVITNHPMTIAEGYIDQIILRITHYALCGVGPLCRVLCSRMFCGNGLFWCCRYHVDLSVLLCVFIPQLLAHVDILIGIGSLISDSLSPMISQYSQDPILLHCP